MTRPSYQQCLEAGMSQRECAEARGVTVASVSIWAKRNGATFRDVAGSPEFAEARDEQMRKMRADPAIDRRPKYLRALTDAERADYDEIKKVGCTKNEALRAIGRDDLIKGGEA